MKEEEGFSTREKQLFQREAVHFRLRPAEEQPAVRRGAKAIGIFLQHLRRIEAGIGREGHEPHRGVFRQGGLNLGHHTGKIIRVDQDARGGMGEYLHQLTPVQSPVQGGMDGAQLAAGKEGIQMFVAITRKDCDPIPFLDALRSQRIR